MAPDSVILNASIRQNIALSRQNASDIQIYRAALQAQLLNFIEDDFDFFEPGKTNEIARAKKIKENLTGVISRLAHMFDNFKTLGKHFTDIDLQKILLNTFTHADKTFIRKISERLQEFVDFVALALDKAIGDTGSPRLNWIDLVIMFEWNLELADVMKEQPFDEDQLDSF